MESEETALGPTEEVPNKSAALQVNDDGGQREEGPVEACSEQPPSDEQEQDMDIEEGQQLFDANKRVKVRSRSRPCSL
jgi:hypothetical protein